MRAIRTLIRFHIFSPNGRMTSSDRPSASSQARSSFTGSRAGRPDPVHLVGAFAALDVLRVTTPQPSPRNRPPRGRDVEDEPGIRRGHNQFPARLVRSSAPRGDKSMPVKRRVAKSGRTDLPPKCFAAFEADDEWALARALKLPPWLPSPLDESLAGPAPYGPGTCWAISRPDALEIRLEILAAMKRRRGKPKMLGDFG
jgi:hypothetical protein